MLLRLTVKQRDTFLLMVSRPDDSLREWAGKLGISHTALVDRLGCLEKKHYITNNDGLRSVTASGIDQVMTDGVHSRFIKSK